MNNVTQCDVNNIYGDITDILTNSATECGSLKATSSKRNKQCNELKLHKAWWNADRLRLKSHT